MNGQELRDLQSRKGLSDAEMAALLDMSEPAYADMARRQRPITKKAAKAIASAGLEETGGEESLGAFPPPGDPLPGLDDLPEPPYNPSEPPDGAGQEEAAPKAKRRSRARSASGLTAWQEETAQAVVGLVCGADEVLEVNGQKVPFRVPGLCDLIARVDQFDANVLYTGTPALSVALVKIAPRHPWLKQALQTLTSGGEYRELTQAVLAIAVPIAVHHGAFGLGGAAPPPPAESESEPVPAA